MFGFGGLGMGFGMLFWLVVPVLLVLWLMNRDSRGYGMGHSSNAEETLRARYARGEISDEEFRRMREELRR